MRLGAHKEGQPTDALLIGGSLTRSRSRTTADEFNSPEEAARYCTAGAVASLIESMKEDETLEIFGCEKDGAK
jgi:hypothetical protein